jgi:glycogen debranching enzyme
VSAFAIVGQNQRARDLIERLLSVASPVGLYAEEFNTTTGRRLGNFPQAFSHLALIQAAAAIILAEQLEEIGFPTGAASALAGKRVSRSGPPVSMCRPTRSARAPCA